MISMTRSATLQCATPMLAVRSHRSAPHSDLALAHLGAKSVGDRQRIALIGSWQQQGEKPIFELAPLIHIPGSGLEQTPHYLSQE